MNTVTTCPRCRGGIWVTDLAEWSVDADPERLRRQGWVGSGGGDRARVAIHLGCLSWAEKDVILGGPRPPQPRVHAPATVRRSLRFARSAPPVAEPLPAA